MLIVCLYIVIFPIFVSSQFLSYDAIRMRVPGRCPSGDYDCGLGQCVPISQFRDGKPDCMDGSDEWCFIGQVSCGPTHCADYKDALACIVYPKCDGSSKQLPWCSVSKEKLCADKRSFPCKGYGECVLWEWLMDGKKDCIDGSDEDENYVMPLESALRCERNKSGLVLPQPIPPPPEDHPSLYVQGCSFCPNAKPPSAVPPLSESEENHVEMTTPKYPFAVAVPLDKTPVPLSNFPTFPTDDTKIVVGEFFPPGITFSKVTKQSPVGEFFPTLISPQDVTHTEQSIPHPSIPNVPAYPETVKIITHTIPPPAGPIYPKPPIIFPQPTSFENKESFGVPSEASPSEMEMKATSTEGNWPIPIFSSTESPSTQGTFFPITYPAILNIPDNRIPPVYPAVVITRPLRPESNNRIHPTAVNVESNNYGISALFTTSLPSTSSEPFQENSYETQNSKPDKAEVGFKHVKPPKYEPTDGFSPFNPPRVPFTNTGPKNNVNNQNIETLIPLISGNLLPTFPTRKPLEENFYTFPTDQKATETDENSEADLGGYESLRTRPGTDFESITHAPHSITTSSSLSFPPAFIPLHPNTDSVTPQTTRKTTTSSSKGGEGWFEETTATTTTRASRTTLSHSHIIHVGPNGIIDTTNGEENETEGPNHENKPTEEEHKSEEETKTGDQSGHVIHIGSTGEPTKGSTSTTTELSTTPGATERTVETEGNHSVQNDCLKILEGNDESNVICECENGQFKNPQSGKCEESLSLTNVKININSVCGTNNIPEASKQRVIHRIISKKVGYPSCIRPGQLNNAHVATISCESCDLAEINRLMNRRSLEETGAVNITAEALGKDLCDDSNFNHCHIYADCTVDNGGLRYACRCKKGTIDNSNGYGRHCEGFPEESDCVMVFGICLIVWLLFLLGVFMLTNLFCLAAYFLCRKRCCRHIAIHPAGSDGLQRVIIGSKAKRNMDASEKLPHMRAIFAESLKHSAKGSTNVASAFAFADFKRKKVSKAPEMSQVIEENLSPSHSTDGVHLPGVQSLPKMNSLAKLSSHTTISEPTTPAAVMETPILEKNSSSVSLVSANTGNEHSPKLPSLPLPLPVPIKTSSSASNLEDKRTEVVRKLSDAGSIGRPSSAQSIGNQPTIWETYRVLGQQYSKSDPNERKPSVDSLELMFEARLAETARTARNNATVRTEASESAPITFIAKPTVSLDDNGVAKSSSADVPSSSKLEADADENMRSEADIEKNLEDAAEKTQNEADAKIAEMIGTTSYRPSQGESESSIEDKNRTFEDDLTTQVNINETAPSLEKSLEAALLIEMAKRGIELPLSPKTPVPTSDESEIVKEHNDSKESEVDVDLDMKPVGGKMSESRKSSAKSVSSLKKSKLPSASSSSRSRNASASSKKSIHPEPEISTAKFAPFGVQKGKSIRGGKSFLRRSGPNDGITSTDESDPEVAFFKRLDAMREDASRYQVHPPNRKYSKRRRPERTLSSISEKSAEVSAEAGIDYPLDTSISCPATTRSYLEPKPIARYFFKRKVVEVTGETSDVDIPKSTPITVAQPIVSSPDIPDVTLRKSRENLNDSESPNEEMISSGSHSRLHSKKVTNSITKTSKDKRPPMSSSRASSRRSSQMTSRAPSPGNGDDAASHTSRSTRHSVISRKIAIRKHELKAVSGSAHDLSHPRTSRTGLMQSSMRGAKSVGDLSRHHRPGWDISPHRDSLRPTEFLPPITPTRGVRTTVNSPQHRSRRSDSHFSLTSLPASHSPTSFWSSPYFNPSEDMRKPPKEDLWWNPNKNL